MSEHRIALVMGLALAFASGCAGPQSGGAHGHAHGPDGGHGHPHGAGQDGEPEPPDQVVTQFGEATELFVEFPALVKDRSWPFAVHLTRLSDFKPLLTGTVTVTLTGAGAPEERFVQEGPSRPGYFRTVVRPEHHGLREVTLSITSEEITDVHELGPYVVYRSVVESIESEPLEQDDSGAEDIVFLKEQQWKLDFRLEEVEARVLRPSLVANGTLRPRHQGEAWVSAPQEGRLLEAGGDFPHLGMEVEKNQALAVLAVPFRGTAGDPATLELAVQRSRVEFTAAEQELARLEGLFVREAIPERRVIEAQSRKDKAWAELAAARSRQQSFQAMQRSDGEGAAGRIQLKAPIAGSVVASNAVPGVFVGPGTQLFHLVDLDRLWLEVHVPVSQISRVEQAPGAWFEVEGSTQAFEVTAETGGRLVAVGGMADTQTRTVPVIFELPNPDRALRVGMYARVRVLTGPPREATAAPHRAFVEEEGKVVAYVQLDGESFERRIVTLGLRDGEWVEIVEGLEPGDVLVTRGAYYVRLAAAGGAVPSHGHAH